ncbi:hypothetical protein [Robertmurraya massiliosenegalensis]|uniref:hypothetical protein n=1 Tax=Robertmurraya massiliosenegalensis TaxID=1287657 RepID=UPI000309B895|nr:hypothetical protein [Robertmurraya massiliosenegalensis]
MRILLMIVLCLTIYFIRLRKAIMKDKKERRAFFFFSFLSITMATFIFFEVPIDRITSFFNQTLGEITKHVIKI